MANPSAWVSTARDCPTPAEAKALARDLLFDQGTRWPHVQTAGLVAAGLGQLFDASDAGLLVAAATLHDIGYSPRIARIGFHPLDGALFLRAEGYPERLASLVAHHSWALLTAPEHGVHDLAEQFPREDSLLADALVYADMHAAPDGQITAPERRLADIAQRHQQPIQLARADHLRASIQRVTQAMSRMAQSR